MGEHSAEIDARDLARIRRWAEAYKPGQSMTVSRDLVLRLVAAAETSTRVVPPGLHPCVGCGLELDGDDPNDRCDACTPPASSAQPDEDGGA